MRKTVKLEEALKLQYGNPYHKEQVLNAKKLFDDVNKFYPCECECEIEETENGLYFEHAKHYLINDICPITVSYGSYRKKYHFSRTSDFKNISNWIVTEAEKKYEKPNQVGVLSKKKISDWVTYHQNIYLEIKKADDERGDDVSRFLETLKGEDVKWLRDDKKSGEIVRNGLRYHFVINDGYVSESIELLYSVDKNLKNFKLLSDNKINRENKINRILNET